MPFHFIFITFPLPPRAIPMKPRPARPIASCQPFRPGIPLRSKVEVDYFTAVDAYRAEAPYERRISMSSRTEAARTNGNDIDTGRENEKTLVTHKPDNPS